MSCRIEGDLKDRTGSLVLANRRRHIQSCRYWNGARVLTSADVRVFRLSKLSKKLLFSLGTNMFSKHGPLYKKHEVLAIILFAVRILVFAYLVEMLYSIEATNNSS